MTDFFIPMKERIDLKAKGLYEMQKKQKYIYDDGCYTSWN